MRYLIIAYICVYALAIVGAVIGSLLPSEPGEEKESIQAHIVDGITAVVLISGMLFILVRMDFPLIKNIWKVVVPIVVGYQIWFGWRDRRDAIARGEKSKDPKKIAFSDIGTLILIVPAFLLNTYYSYN